jgi:hypothetical protein
MTDNEAFTVWYAAYPKKKAKGDAIKAWGQTKKDRIELNAMLQILEAQCASKEWQKAEGEFIPYPATYLRRLQFLDEMEVTLPQDQVAWRETWPGIVAKGKQFGLLESDFTQPYLFKEAVLKRADAEVNKNVINLKTA